MPLRILIVRKDFLEEEARTKERIIQTQLARDVATEAHEAATRMKTIQAEYQCLVVNCGMPMTICHSTHSDLQHREGSKVVYNFATEEERDSSPACSWAAGSS